MSYPAFFNQSQNFTHKKSLTNVFRDCRKVNKLVRDALYHVHSHYMVRIVDKQIISLTNVLLSRASKTKVLSFALKWVWNLAQSDPKFSYGN